MKATLLTLGRERSYRFKKATDFAKATGVESIGLSAREASYYLKTPSGDGCVYSVDCDGALRNRKSTIDDHIGICPVLEFSSEDEIRKNGGEIIPSKNAADINRLKLGVYASEALSKIEQEEWTEKLKMRALKECGSYTLYENKFKYEVPVYEYNGKRAVRKKVNFLHEDQKIYTSGGGVYEDGNYVWFNIKDKIWIFDAANLTAESTEVMLGGIPFDTELNNYYNEEDFPKTNMSKYLNDVFLSELLQFNNKPLTNNKVNSESNNNSDKEKFIKTNIDESLDDTPLLEPSNIENTTLYDNQIKTSSDKSSKPKKNKKRLFKIKKRKLEFKNPFFKQVLSVRSEISDSLEPKLINEYIQKLNKISNSYANSLKEHYYLIKKNPNYEIEIMEKYISLLESLRADIRHANEFDEFSDNLLDDLEILEGNMDEPSLK